MFSNIKSLSINLFKFIFLLATLIIAFILIMPLFPSFKEGWSNASPYILCAKYLLISFIFIYWNQVCLFFINDENAVSHFIKARNKLLILFIFIESITWFSRGAL